MNRRETIKYRLALMSRAIAVFVLLWLPMLTPTRPIYAQHRTSPVQFQGNVSFSTEIYQAYGIAARHPNAVSRAIVQSALTFSDKMRLPFELYLISSESKSRQPFNQFGINPQLFGWLSLHAGYFSANLSELSFGDVRLFGGGLEARPGNFRFSLLYGRMRQAIAPDLTLGFAGEYQRRALACKIGYGKEGHGFVDLNFVRAVDDSSSLASSSATLAPYENALASLQFGFPFASNKLRVRGELAVAAFTNDTRTQEKEIGVDFLSALFTPRFSSQIDGASTLSVTLAPSNNFSLALDGRWIGPGYVTLGYAQLQNDVLETRLAPSLRFFGGKVFLRGSAGLRYNNLRHNRLVTTRRVIGSFATTVQLSRALGFDAQYANYGMRSLPKHDTLRIQNIMQSFSFSPRFLFNALGATNTVMLNHARQNVDDKNAITASLNRNRTRTAMATWTMAFPTSLSFSTVLAYHKAGIGRLTTRISSVSETISRSFLKYKFSTALTLGYNLVKTISTDRQFSGRFTASYRMERWGTFALMLSTNSYSYGTSSPDADFAESQGVLQYSLSL
jgi:hypothetical protein